MKKKPKIKIPRKDRIPHCLRGKTYYICGDLVEERIIQEGNKTFRKFTKYKKHFVPKLTKRNNLHRVLSREVSWCFSIRGPWYKTWVEYNEKTNKTITLANGRAVVAEKVGV